MLRKQWNEYASKARDIAKHIVTGAEESRETHARWSKVIDYLDVLATSALNEKYANDGSKSSIHTYWGGNQEIATEHADGSNGIFRTNGSCESTNNPMDIEVKEYINNLGENKQYNMNKKLIRLTESDLHRIVKESVNKVLTELDWRTYANAAKKSGDEAIGRIKSGEKFSDLKNDKDFTKRARQHNAFRNQAVQGSREKFKDYGGEDFDLYTTIGPDDHIYANAEGDNWPNRMVTDKEGKTMMCGFSKPKMVNVKPDRYFGYDKDKISDWNQFSKEINDYNSGKSQYIKGKGWQ